MAKTTPTSEDPLAGLGIPPLPTGTTQTANPLGVPKGFKPATHQVSPTGMGGLEGLPGQTQPGEVADVNALGTSIQSEPYVQGDEWAPLNDPESIGPLQEQLVQAGLLNPKNVVLGRWDTTSAAAYKTLLTTANAYGANKDDALTYLMNTSPGVKGASTGQAAKITNPEDSKAAFRAAAVKLTGGVSLPKAQQDAFAAWYQAQEKAVVQAGNTADPNGTYTDAPSLGTAAENYIMQHDKGDAVAYGMASRSQEFQDLLASTSVPGGK